MTWDLTGGVLVIWEALTNTWNTLTVALTPLPDFAPTLLYFTEQVMVLVQNPQISLLIAAITGGIISQLPEKLRPRGWLVSIAVSTALVSLVSVAGGVGAGMRTNLLLGLMLWVATSQWYDFLKQQFTKTEEVKTLPVEWQI